MAAITTTRTACASSLKQAIIHQSLAAMNRTRVFLARPTFLGAATAVVFLWGSLVPGLLPLSWSTQGIISGFWMALGYGLGTGVRGLYGKLVGWRPGNALQRVTWIILLVLAGSLTAWSLIVQYQWQVDVRRLMGMSGPMLYYPVAVALVALLVAVVLVLLARLVRAGYRQYITVVSRYLPPFAARTVGVVTSVVLVVFMIDTLVGEHIFTELNRRYLATDAHYDSQVQQPTSPYRSGGVDSRIPWETLGMQGRSFVTQAPGVGELTRFNGTAAMEPIRIYVGRQSAPTAAQRAALAVAELERTGAFGRELLVLVTPTGSGWVDPYAVAPLEYMYGGNTAAVVMQYSYLPSWVMMLGNQDRANEAAQALITAVHTRLQREPAATRPRLVIYGQSLGAFASETAFAGPDDIKERTNGVLFVGPPGVSRMWQDFTNHRDAGSPLWKPIYNQGTTVRFGFDLQSLSEPQSPWEGPRVVYLQHASDPITWWSGAMLLRRPAWMEEPLGPDVSTKMRYYPIATFLRVTVDLMLGLGAPPGHGHRYDVSQAEAWTLIIPPAGWTRDDTSRLIAAVEPQQ